MNTPLKKNDPAQALEFFEKKMQFTTGPVEDFEKGHLPGAINLPREKWNDRDGLNRDRLNVLYCYSHVCHLAASAAVEFASYGYSVMEMDGGFKTWEENDLEVEKGGGSREPKSSKAMSA